MEFAGYLFNNEIEGNFKGLQVGTLTDFDEGVMIGAQIGFSNQVQSRAKLIGAQIGLTCNAQHLYGVQIGLICEGVEGTYLQIGVLTLRSDADKWYKRFSPIIGFSFERKERSLELEVI